MSAKPQTVPALASRAVQPAVISPAVLLRAHVKLLKLNLNALVVATTAVGFVLANGRGPLDWPRLGLTLLGTALAAWGASALNQYLERDLDARMVRTRTRPLPAGTLSPGYAYMLGMLLMAGGDLLLTVKVNWLTGLLALVTQVLYLCIYTPLKRRSSLNTLVGAVVGAIPPLMGWTACAGWLDAGAWLLAGILFAWQVPHFLALAWMYREDYAHGGFVMLPGVDRSGQLTFGMMLGYSLLLIPLGLGLTLFGSAGWFSAWAAFLLGLGLLLLAQTVVRQRTFLAARRLFLASVVYLPLLLGIAVADRGNAVARDTAVEYPQAAAAMTATDSQR